MLGLSRLWFVLMLGLSRLWFVFMLGVADYGSLLFFSFLFFSSFSSCFLNCAMVRVYAGM